MKTNLLKLAFVAVFLCLAIGVWASPTATLKAEYNYRTNNNDPTGWTTFKDCSQSSNDQVEVYNGARFFAVQTWEITEIDNVSSATISFTRVSGQTNNGDLSLWAFPYEALTSNTFSKAEGSFLDNVKTVLGVYPGNTIANDYLATSTGGATRTLTLDASAIAALKAAGSVEDGTLTVNVLLTTKTSTNNYKYYSLLNEKHATMAVTTYGVMNTTQSKGYDKLADAVTDAGDGDVINVYKDQTVSGDRITIEKNLTIQGATEGVKILRATGLDALTILAKGNITLKNLVFDGQKVSRSKDAVECGSGTLTLDGVTFQNYVYATDNNADVKNNGNSLVLKNTNVFVKGVYLNNRKRIDVGSANISADKKLNVYVASDYIDGYVIIQNCQNVNYFNLMDDTRELYVSKTSGNGELSIRTQQIVVTRDTTTDSYGTICLPYDATSTGVVLMEMAGRNAEGTGIAFDFVDGTEEDATNATIKAGVPYLYRATADAQVFTCDMTSTKATAPATVNYFTGTFADKEVAEGVYFLYTADDKFHPAESAGKIGAYKCYLNTTDINTINVAGAATSARACVFGVFGNETTGIEGLNGSSSSTCAKYVQNGQIVVVKNGQKYNTAGQLLK